MRLAGVAARDWLVVLLPSAAQVPLTMAEDAHRVFGAEVLRVYDIGVSGIHRLPSKLIRSADAVVAVAGMEGALPTVLVDS